MTEGAGTPRTILFVMQHAGFVRNYEEPIRILSRRGYRIHVAYLRAVASKGGMSFAALVRDCENVTVEPAPARTGGMWTAFADTIRILIDYVRYFDSRYARATLLRARIEENRRLFPALRHLMRPVRLFGDRGSRTVIRLLQRVEAATPVDAAARRLVDELRPDLVLVTPLVDFGSPQVDYVRAAQELGIPTGLCVASWDNLTNKGHVRVVPDRVFVWNEAQREEAVSLHGVPPERIVVTGAQLFDHWFGWRPVRSREEFCRTVGLDPERPFVVFLGSTTWIAPAEVFFVERWIRRIRDADDPAVAELGILVRPHPTTARRYLTLDTTGVENVVVWPPYTPDVFEYFTDSRKNDFFETLTYSAAAVGVNTSALIEAGIVGRTVCTVRDPDFDHAQDGTLHFAHLAKGETGLVRVAEGMEEHLRDLATAVATAGSEDERARTFVRSFVRPHGLEVPAAPILADAIAAAAELHVEPRPASASARVLRPLLVPAARGVLRLDPARRRDERDERDAFPLARPLAWLAVRLVVVGLTGTWLARRAVGKALRTLPERFRPAADRSPSNPAADDEPAPLRSRADDKAII